MVASSIKYIVALVTVAAFGVGTCSAQQTAAPVAAATAVPGTAAATAPPATGAPVEDGWGGCIDPDNRDQLVKLGEKTTICVTLSSSAEWNIPPPSARTLRLSFQPEADEYSRFHVPSSYQDLIFSKSTAIYDGSNNVTLHVSSQKVLSFQRMFYTPNAGAGRIFPYLTAIIDVSKGVVQGITWDDACIFCSKDKCEEDTYDFDGVLGTQEEYKQPTKGCYIQEPECTAVTAGKATNCDITVYVVWTGDDVDGRALQSSAFRFSAFPEQELQNRITNNLPDLPFGLGGGGDDQSTTDGSGADGAA